MILNWQTDHDSTLFLGNGTQFIRNLFDYNNLGLLQYNHKLNYFRATIYLVSLISIFIATSELTFAQLYIIWLLLFIQTGLVIISRVLHFPYVIGCLLVPMQSFICESKFNLIHWTKKCLWNAGRCSLQTTVIIW